VTELGTTTAALDELSSTVDPSAPVTFESVNFAVVDVPPAMDAGETVRLRIVSACAKQATRRRASKKPIFRLRVRACTNWVMVVLSGLSFWLAKSTRQFPVSIITRPAVGGPNR